MPLAREFWAFIAELHNIPGSGPPAKRPFLGNTFVIVQCVQSGNNVSRSPRCTANLNTKKKKNTYKPLSAVR